jgi:signal transduction histidine kinase
MYFHAGILVKKLILANGGFVHFNILPLFCILTNYMDSNTVLGRGALKTAAFLVVIGIMLVLVNSFDTKIFELLPFLPYWSVSALSIVSFFVLGFFLWQSERKSEVLKYEFVNIVTHKFRTPLTYVTWSIENLKKSQTVEERAESVRQIENATSRLLEMTDIMIDVARIDEGYSYVFKAESLRELVERTMMLYTDRIREKGIQFNINMDYNLPLISVDVKRMELVVKTLLENAFTYTPKGGMISINVNLVGDKSIRFSITDTGIGIERKDLAHIFSKFYRSKDATGADTEGMGLGLFIAKNIIERHGGRIFAASDGKGKGSTFTFELPLRHGR